MKTQKYNGWSNYATWRINLEWFDGDHIIGGADYLREVVEEALNDNCRNETTLSYALAFLSDVNWNEIAEAMESSKIEELIYEFNNMKSEPIIEINLAEYGAGEGCEFEIYNLSVNKNGLHTDTGLTVEWDINEDLDWHLDALMEEIVNNL